MRKIIAAVIASAATGTMAMADGPAPAVVEPEVSVPVVPLAPWEGGYVGGQLGYGFSELDLDSDDLRNLDDADGFIGGLMAGYLWSLGNGWYAGPELQYDFADLSITDPDTGDSADFDEIGRLKVRAGKELGDGLLYGTTGLAYGSIGGGALNSVDDLSGDDQGYLFGFGYDYLLSESFAIGAEYMYHVFDSIGDAGAEVNVNTVHLRGMFRF
ncbi:MAG: outer membrane beta-barrel protein [Pseudomonadota bacterium]